MDAKFGDKVKCSAYIKKSGKHFKIDNGACKASLVCPKGGELVVVPESPFNERFEYREDKVTKLEEDAYVNRFDTVPCDFNGVFVGTVRLGTELGCLLKQVDCHDYWACQVDNPQIFAVVYYRNNAKRTVPMDCVSLLEGK